LPPSPNMAEALIVESKRSSPAIKSLVACTQHGVI
jgi:hypothetical protein